jgi:hypothetical protein
VGRLSHRKETGEYNIGVRAKGGFAAGATIDGKPLAMEYLDSEHSQSKDRAHSP